VALDERTGQLRPRLRETETMTTNCKGVGSGDEADEDEDVGMARPEWVLMLAETSESVA
jgi:hypothetical protein